jgi:hypothetical protein
VFGTPQHSPQRHRVLPVPAYVINSYLEVLGRYAADMFQNIQLTLINIYSSARVFYLPPYSTFLHIMVELRKRKAPVPLPVPEKKTKQAPKPKQEDVTDNDIEKTPAPKVPEVDDTIDIETFGGEFETNEGEKTTLKKLLEESKSGVVFFTYPKASTPGCKSLCPAQCFS